jgi:hypothetical protein
MQQVIHDLPTGFLRTLTANRVGTPRTLLGIQLAEAGQAIGKLIPCCEALPRQLLLAGCAYKALLMPGLLPVSDTSCGDGLERQAGELGGVTSVLAKHPLSLLLPVDDGIASPRKNPVCLKSQTKCSSIITPTRSFIPALHLLPGFPLAFVPWCWPSAFHMVPEDLKHGCEGQKQCHGGVMAR